ncbi:hypothetical protein AWC11_16510 [Mycobacterium interjectum]|nr:hypothetical protein AWC11_16510 [Mycobacterium interjectum]
MNYPIASTPNASVHQVPGSGRNKLAFTAQELEAIGQQLLAGFMRQVVKALFGVVTSQNLGVLNAQVNAWANGVEGDISAAAAELEALIDNAEQGTAAELGTALAELITGYSDLLNALYGAESIASQVLVSAIPTGIPRANISGLTGYLTNLTSSGVLSLSGLASGSLPAGVTAGISQITSLSGYLTNLSSSGVLSGISAVTGLGGYLTNLSSSGVLALSGLASGALPAGVTAAISNVTGLGGYLTHLTSGGVLALAGLASGALPSGITLPGAQLTGLASGIQSWLAAGGALPAATSIAASQLTSLATGVGSWLTSGGALPSATTVGGQLVGDIQSSVATAISTLFPVSAAGDPYWGNVVALLHCDGTNGATTFTDSSPLAANWTATNGAVTATAQAKFGTASANFPNSTSVIIAPNPTSNYAFGTADFTIEAWIYVTAYTATWMTIWDARTATTGGTIAVSAAGALSYWFAGMGKISSAAAAVTTGVWHHVAVARASGSTKLFLDGTQVGSTYADTNSYDDPGAGDVSVGNYRTGTLPFGPNNYIDELRVTKGIARYTGNFTPSAAAFPSGFVTYSGMGSALNTALTISGKALSTLFNASGVVASQIAGALNPAVTFLVGGSNIALSTLLANLNATGLFDASALTNMTNIPAIALAKVTSLTGYLAHLNTSGLLDAVSSVTGLSGYLTNLSGSGVLALAGLASGSLPAGITAGISQITSLGGYLTNLNASGVLALSGLATGALPSGITLAASQLTGALNTGLTIGGTALSTLFSGGQLAASQIAGALNTAVTIAGQTVADVQSNAASAVGQLEDAADNALGGAAAAATAFGSALSSGITDWFNAWTGNSRSAASASDLAAAAAAAVTTTTTHTSQISGIQAQLPSFYGGGAGGLSVSQSFSGSLPAGYSSVSTIATASVKYNTAATTDTQAVSGSWSVADGNAKYLFLRANSGFTTYDYVKLQNNDPATGGAKCEIGTVVAGVKTVFDTFTLPGDGTVVATSAYTLDAVDYLFTLTGPSGLNISYTDSSHVSQVGSSYRYGGFGTDGWAREITHYSAAGSFTYDVPGWAVAGTRFDLAGVGGGGGGAAYGGSYEFGGAAGAWFSASAVYNTDIPLTTTTFGVTVGAAGTGVPAGNGYGGAGGNSVITITGHSTLTGTGGAGGSPSTGSGSVNGASPGNQKLQNVLYTGGAADTTYNTNGNTPGGGGIGLTGDAGAPGAAWITANDLTLPGSLGFWAFYDSAVAGPATALVATNETTTSTTYTDLTTTTDQVTVNIGSSGMAILMGSAQVSQSYTGYGPFIGFAASGSNTIAVTDLAGVEVYVPGNAGAVINKAVIGNSILLTDLSPGATTFKLKYKVDGSGATTYFSNRRIAVIPL